PSLPRPWAEAPKAAAGRRPSGAPCLGTPGKPILCNSRLGTGAMTHSEVPVGWTGEMPDPLSAPALYDGLLWRRPLAYVLDLVLIGLIIGGWFWLVLMSLGLLWPLTSLAFLLIPMLYHAWLVGGRHSATFGMRT